MKRHVLGAVLLCMAAFHPASALEMERYSALQDRLDKGDNEAVRAEIRPLAESGDVDALFLMGFSYMVPEDRADMEKARPWLKQAADKGLIHAVNAMGFTYYFLQPPDIDNAALWYRKAADAGDDPARLNLASVYAEHPERFPDDCALRLPLYEAVQNPELKRMADLHRARIIDEGCAGKAGDHAAAFPLYQAAAERGDAMAQFWMAIAYNTGWGVTKDEEKGWDWTRRSAESGHPEAQWYMGVAAARGNSQPRDPAAALAWFTKSAEGGSLRGMTSLAVMYATGDGTAIDYPQALAWYRKAADLGYDHAQRGLAVMHAMGQGVETDLVEAKKWINLSREQGNVEAPPVDDMLTRRMTEEQIAEAKRRSEAWKAANMGRGT